MKRIRRLTLGVALSVVLAAVGVYMVSRAYDMSHVYGVPAVTDVLLDSSGEHLYIAYPRDNLVVEVDPLNMEEIRHFSVTHPGDIEISPDGSFLYCTRRGLPGGVSRIRLSDGNVQTILLDGDVTQFALDPSGTRLWAVERLWPTEGTVYDDEAIDAEPDSGRLTEISCETSLTKTRSVVTEALPASIYYSPYSNKLYVLHQTSRMLGDGSGVLSEDHLLVDANPLIIYELNDLSKVGEIYAGHCSDLSDYGQLSKWDDSGRYLAVSCPRRAVPEFSLRVIDTADDSVAFDLTFPDYYGDPMWLIYAHKVPGLNELWTSVYWGKINDSVNDTRALLVRINMVNQSGDVFAVDGSARRSGDFAVSGDGDTLFLTSPTTGEVIVWSPPDANQESPPPSPPPPPPSPPPGDGGR